MSARPAILLGAALLVIGCVPAGDYAPPMTPRAPAPRTWAQPGAAWGPAQEWGRASFYSDRLAGRRTASGEPYDPRALTAAHRTLPLGSFVDVARADGRHVVVRINDRGPYARGRVIDLSRGAAAALGMEREGVVDVVLRVVWWPSR